MKNSAGSLTPTLASKLVPSYSTMHEHASWFQTPTQGKAMVKAFDCIAYHAIPSVWLALPENNLQHFSTRLSQLGFASMPSQPLCVLMLL